jgi:hypothetical protein
MHGIDLIGLVAPQLRPREVSDPSRIDDAHEVPSLMECKGDAEAVAFGCLQTGVNLSDLVLAEPRNQVPILGGLHHRYARIRFRKRQSFVRAHVVLAPTSEAMGDEGAALPMLVQSGNLSLEIWSSGGCRLIARAPLNAV